MKAERSARGTAIRETRKRLGISAKALAAKAGIDRDTLAALETGTLKGRPYVRGPHPRLVEAAEQALANLQQERAR